MSRQSAGLVEGGDVVVLTAAGTIKLDDSYHGKLIVLKNATGGQHFSLPAPKAGYRVSFVSGVDLATSNNVITARDADYAAANIIAGGISSPGVADFTVGTEVDVISFVQGVADIGDRVDLVSDGTQWYVSGVMGVSTAITLA
jgi:hypothetical protein